MTSIVIGGGAIALRYAQRKLQEFQEAQAKEFIEKQRRFQHFEATERTCTQAIQSLYPSVIEAISKLYDTDLILKELRERKAGSLSMAEKVDLWDQLLVKSFTKVVTLVNASTLLVIILRVQLNILGGYMYKEVDAESKVITQEIQNKYLSLVQHFLKDGILDLALMIRNNVERTLKKYDLKQKLDLAEVEQIFWSIQMSVNAEIENNENKTLAKFALPNEETLQECEIIRKMLVETIDMLETEEVMGILTHHIGQGYSTTTDEIANFFATAGKNNNKDDEDIFNINKVQVPLAKLIPIVNGLSPKALNGKPLPHDLLNLLVNSEKIKMLGANTYEVFSL